MLLTALLLTLAAIDDPVVPDPPVKLIYDTDMGNDVDDGFALGVIHNLQSRGECELLAVTITKDHDQAAPFTDLLNHYYGRGDIPIGVVRDGPTQQEGRFLPLARERDGDAYRYPHDLESGKDAPEATALLRKVLAAQPDNSVAIAQVGFSTNLARLLDTPPDDYSPLTGKELAAKKVSVLSVMAGAFEPFNGKPHREYNVVMDIPAAQKLAAEWPGTIIYSGFEIGIKTALRVEHIQQDFRYDPNHPMSAAYLVYNNAYRDQPSWDLTSVLYAVRPNRGYFGLSEPGTVTYDDKGLTTFTPDPNGRHKYLTVDPTQTERVKESLATLTTAPPAH